MVSKGGAKNTKQGNAEPSKREILEEIIRANSGALLRKDIRGSSGNDGRIDINPFKPKGSRPIAEILLTSQFVDTDELEVTLKNILKVDYDRYYSLAKQKLMIEGSA